MRKSRAQGDFPVLDSREFFLNKLREQVSVFIMATSKPLPIILAACLTASAVAQTPEQAPEQPPASEQSSTTTTTTRTRGISREASAALSAAYRYQPPPPEPEETDEDLDMREVDRPRNEIIRLPRYLVEEQRPPIFSEQNLYNRQQLEKLAAQRYLSEFHRNMLSRYRIGREDQAFAQLMYQENQRLQSLSTFGQQASLYRAAGDEEKADAVEEQANSSFVRQPDVGTTRLPGAPFGIQQPR